MNLVRRATLIVLACVVLELPAYAQSVPFAGVMAGFNESHFASSPKNDGKTDPGVMVGGYVVFRRDKGFKIQPEIQFAEHREDVAFGGHMVRYSTNYINLGLMTRLKLFKGFYTTQGPQISLPVRSKLDLGTATVDIKDDTTWDFTLPAGVGRQFGRVGVEGRYEAGLRRVEKAPLGNFIKRERAFTIFATLGF